LRFLSDEFFQLSDIADEHCIFILLCLSASTASRYKHEHPVLIQRLIFELMRDSLIKIIPYFIKKTYQ
jgi:hypothetical protein